MPRSVKTDNPPWEGKIIRITLSNGYWAYRPVCLIGTPDFQIPRPNPRPKQREQVTWSNPKGEWRASVYYFGKTTGSDPATSEHRRIDVPNGWSYSPWSCPWREDAPPPAERHRKKLERAEARKRFDVKLTRVNPGFSERFKAMESGEKNVPNLRSLPTTKLRDDPVVNGKELAAAGDELPSDQWCVMDRDLKPKDERVLVVSREDKELQDAIREIRAKDAMEEHVSLESVVHDQPLYPVKVAQKRRGRPKVSSNNGKAHSSPEISFQIEGLENTDNIDDIPWEGFLEELEAQGWVLMSGKLEDEDDSISVAESWVLTSGEDFDEQVNEIRR